MIVWTQENKVQASSFVCCTYCKVQNFIRFLKQKCLYHLNSILFWPIFLILLHLCWNRMCKGTSTMTRFAIRDAIYRAIWCLQCSNSRFAMPPRFAICVSTMKATSQIANRRRFIANRQCVYNSAIRDATRDLRRRFWKWKNHLFLRRRAIWPYQIFIKS